MSGKQSAPPEADDRPDADFVTRWSRLKHQAAKHAGTTVTGTAAAHHAPAENTGLKAGQAASTAVLTDEDMPDIESLTPESDYRDFLSPGVSEKLRKLALRKLFLGKDFNIRDGLDEYDEDYTRFEKLGDIVTSDMRHRLELEAQRRAEQLLQHEDPSSDTASAHDAATHRENDESVDRNIPVTATGRVQPGKIHETADGEQGHDAVEGTTGGEETKMPE